MSFYFPSVDPLYLLKREGTDEDPFLFQKDTGNVSMGYYVLKEIPSFGLGIEVVDENNEPLVKLEGEEKPEIGQYAVDFTVGILHFHESMNGKQITASYHGMGFVNIPSTRIMMPNGQDDPVESLQQALDKVDEAITVLGEAGDMDFKGEFNPSSNYKKWNFVTYNNKTFVASKESKGISPDNLDHWRLVSSGVGFSGVYEGGTSYSIGDMVSSQDKKNLYISLITNNDKPLTDETSWQLMITLDDMTQALTEAVDAKILELDNFKLELQIAEEQRDENDLVRDSLVEEMLEDFSATMNLYEENEISRNTGEDNRELAELQRVDAENTRAEFKNTVEAQETLRQVNEESRQQGFESVVSDLGNLTTSVEEGINTIDTKAVQVDSLVGEVDIVLTNVEMSLEDIEEFKHTGEHDPTLNYKKYNLASHEGSTYMAIQDAEVIEIVEEEGLVETIEITDTLYWKLLAEKGKDGTSVTVEGIQADENNNISLEELGYATENAVVEVREDAERGLTERVGVLNDLTTIRKGNIVEAINELKRAVNDITEQIS